MPRTRPARHWVAWGAAAVVMLAGLAAVVPTVPAFGGQQASAPAPKVYANADPVYQQLRDLGLGDTYRVEAVQIPLDAGSLELKSGTITLFAPVNNLETGAIFIGEGHFTLKPPPGIDTRELERRTGSATVEEDVSKAVLRFSDSVYRQISKSWAGKANTPPEAAGILHDWREKVRKQVENPAGLTDGLLAGDDMENVDAEVLSAVYNPNHPPFLTAYLTGARHKDLRFFLRARTGAILQIDSPEEVALVNMGGAATDDGIWYFEHFLSEVNNRTKDSREERRLVAAHSYTIETTIEKNDHLAGQTSVVFEPIYAGERVIRFGLVPTLRVTRVTD